MAWKKNRKNKPKDEESALNYVRRLFRYRLRSEQEIRKRLSREGYPEEIIESVIERLKKAGLVNDERFAYMFAKSELEVYFHGPYVIRRKLKELGVDEEIIEKSLERALEEVDLKEKIRSFVNRFDDMRKARENLFRRGFDVSILDDIDVDDRR